MRVGAAIVAGGRATRLGGVHKGLVRVGGEPIVARQLRVLARPLVDECVLVGGDREAYAPWTRAAVRHIPDRAGRGPLAGLDAALAALDTPVVLLFGCDLPFITRTIVRALVDLSPDAPALVPRLDGRPQPLAARYARAIAPVVQARLERGQLRMMELLDEIGAHYLDVDWRRELLNVNTPEDLARAEELATSAD